MNSEKVRRALNIFNSSLNWTVTSKSLNYSQMVYSDNFQTVYSEDFQTVFDIKENVQSLGNISLLLNVFFFSLMKIKLSWSYVIAVSQSSIRILIYNGDLDSVCNFLGAQIFMQSLGFPSNASHVSETFVYRFLWVILQSFRFGIYAALYQNKYTGVTSQRLLTRFLTFFLRLFCYEDQLPIKINIICFSYLNSDFANIL